MDGWNIIDTISIVTFFVTSIFHFVYLWFYYDDHKDGADGNCPLKLSTELQWVQSLYSISFLGFVIKLLQYLVIFEKIGNKVLVLKEMAWDVVVFGILFGIFALSYGVIMQNILYPNEWRFASIVDGILYKSFFHVYGELFLGKLQSEVQLRNTLYFDYFGQLFLNFKSFIS